MTTEEKARAYDEAIRKAKITLDCCDSVSIATKNTVYGIFPELKESEGDRIRKEIIQYIKTGTYHKDWVAWLEKQGEQKPYGQRKKCSDCQFNYTGECKGSCQMKIDEQKSADKVEPKFHEGEWINGYYTNYKVLSVNNDGYVVEDVDGNKINILFENEKFHHLWTIQDAKDGDVLCYENKDDFKIFIYKYGHILYHCCYSNGHLTPIDSFFVVPKYLLGYIHPATKEQRDTLKRSMTNAGYRWDKEKLKLEKL